MGFLHDYFGLTPIYQFYLVCLVVFLTTFLPLPLPLPLPQHQLGAMMHDTQPDTPMTVNSSLDIPTCDHNSSQPPQLQWNSAEHTNFRAMNHASMDFLINAMHVPCMECGRCGIVRLRPKGNATLHPLTTDCSQCKLLNSLLTLTPASMMRLPSCWLLVMPKLKLLRSRQVSSRDAFQFSYFSQFLTHCSSWKWKRPHVLCQCTQASCACGLSRCSHLRRSRP
jgi:hypothetical protein